MGGNRWMLSSFWLVTDKAKAKCLGEIFASVPPCLTMKFTNRRLTWFFVVSSNIQGVPGGMCQTSGRVFLMLKYTDITQNTYVQIWTVTEIKAREKYGLFAVPSTVPGSRDVIPIGCALSVLVYSRLKCVPCCDCTCKVLGNPKDNYDVSASVFVVQFNGFMSLTS